MSSMSGQTLSAEDLTRTVTIDSHRKQLVESFSFEFKAGNIYSIIGPSGAGKTTLLRLLNRLDEPTSGRIELDSVDTSILNPCQLRRKVGYLFQTPHMFEGNVRDNLMYAQPDTDQQRQIEGAVAACIDRIPLDSSVNHLSAGEKQRVALARLLMNQPEVLLLDELTSALDPTTTEVIENLIINIVAEHNVTAIVVTHDPQQAVRLGGTTLLLVDGRLAEYGPCDQVVNNPSTPEGQNYQARGSQ